MRNPTLALLLASGAALAGCATAPPPPPVEVVGAPACGTYGMIDVDNDGFVTEAEWGLFRDYYAVWDIDRDGMLERAEFEQCFRHHAFLPSSARYDPSYWTYYWSAFDRNDDGWLTGDEYWSAAAWADIDANANGRIDANEWFWWNV